MDYFVLTDWLFFEKKWGGGGVGGGGGGLVWNWTSMVNGIEEFWT